MLLAVNISKNHNKSMHKYTSKYIAHIVSID